MNDGQETFRRFAKQLRTVGGGGMPPGGKGLFAGSGLLIALVAGGFVLNASLFNGMQCFVFVCYIFPEANIPLSS
jgi:hypothetical protein